MDYQQGGPRKKEDLQCIVKTHRSTQLFLYCSERSVKCVCLILEMEVNNDELRGVVSFLVAKSAG